RLNTPLAPVTLPELRPCFADSRRLTGHNRFFAGTGAVLDPLGPAAQDAAAHERWRASVIAMRAALRWAEAPVVVRRHAGGTLLAMAAPGHALFTATEINEWAWEQASGLFQAGGNRAVDPPFDQLHPLGSEFGEVVAAFTARAAAENDPRLSALQAAARDHGVPLFADDDEISLGAGAGSRTWPLAALPDVNDIAWDALRDVPTALVTGSNGKTTTVRLLAALIAAGDLKYRDHVGYSSTEGVAIGGQRAGEGDFSGPAGARLVLRDARVEAAVLETARGGILRRGLAVDRADAAIVTNISADHFGEYGIDSLDDLAGVKLVVAHALASEGTLVLNADDPVLLARARGQACKVALFAADDAHPALAALRDQGGSTCGGDGHHLWLTHRGTRSRLGEIRRMPLTLNGAAIYNVANISAAALAAAAMHVPDTVIAAELTRFGQAREDNPGRLDRWLLADITVLIDYAHNPGGLALLLDAARRVQRDRTGRDARMGLLLGQAGNRTDQAIADIARTAAAGRPDLIVLKEIAGMLRGRARGEVPAMLKNGLLAAGYPPDNIRILADEVDAACELLRWAQAGDVLVLPIHQAAARSIFSALLDDLEKDRWRAGRSLPALSRPILP
ncbi:MAG: Mur ligase family protein, partial [Betaproteobacteria bacterium]